MKAHQNTLGKCDEWLTPRWILEPLGEFDLDPCASVVRPWDTARNCYTIEDDGLAQEWLGRVWLNPPFNRYARPLWMRRMARHNDGIMLIPAATETKAYVEHVWRAASAVCFVETRPHFCYVDGTEAAANCGTAITLIAYGQTNAEILEVSGLGKTLRCEGNGMDEGQRISVTANTTNDL